MALPQDLCINLDGTDPSDLRQYAARMYTLPVEGEDRLTADLLAGYANTKAVAMEYRAAGNIPQALHLEQGCERIYNKLPEYARW